MITPPIRFAAAAYVENFSFNERYMARRPSMVESFPRSYSADLVSWAESLLVRMATPGVDFAELRTDLLSFHVAARRG